MGAKKKITVGIVGIVGLIVIATSLLSKTFNVYRWFQIDFNVISYHPLVPIFGLIGAGGSLFMIFVAGKAKTRKPLWILAVMMAMWFIYELILLLAVIKTYGGIPLV